MSAALWLKYFFHPKVSGHAHALKQCLHWLDILLHDDAADWIVDYPDVVGVINEAVSNQQTEITSSIYFCERFRSMREIRGLIRMYQISLHSCQSYHRSQCQTFQSYQSNYQSSHQCCRVSHSQSQSYHSTESACHTCNAGAASVYDTRSAYLRVTGPVTANSSPIRATTGAVSASHTSSARATSHAGAGYGTSAVSATTAAYHARIHIKASDFTASATRANSTKATNHTRATAAIYRAPTFSHTGVCTRASSTRAINSTAVYHGGSDRYESRPLFHVHAPLHAAILCCYEPRVYASSLRVCPHIPILYTTGSRLPWGLGWLDVLRKQPYGACERFPERTLP